MVETYVWYSCAAMTTLGISAAVISIRLHARLKSLKSIPDNLEAKVFDRTFAVYDPYLQSKRIVHRLLTLLPFVTMFSAFGFALFLFTAVQHGFLLTLSLMVVALAAMNVEEAVETYQNSNTLFQAFKTGREMGTGDLRLLTMTKQILPKVIRYFSCLAALFAMTTVFLLFFWNLLFGVFLEFIALILRISEIVAPFNFLLACFLLALTFFVLQILASSVKRRILDLQ